MQKENNQVKYFRISPVGRVCLGDKISEFQSMSEKVLNSEEKNILLDLSGVTYMDSSGLGEMLKLFLESKNRKKSFTLTNIPQNIAKVLKSTKLDKVFQTIEDPEKLK